MLFVLNKAHNAKRQSTIHEYNGFFGNDKHWTIVWVFGVLASGKVFAFAISSTGHLSMNNTAILKKLFYHY